MNTRICYLYRDASNYKQCGIVVVHGEITSEDLRPHLHFGDLFIPHDVGLPELQKNFAAQGFAFPDDDDHVWHELEMCEPTEDNPTLDISAAELLERFRTADAARWDVQGAEIRLGLNRK
ncbi:MAG: hypothetical protein K9N51_12840 [Candidatus Pacebacteria bacterium]|nr:hypothetical protein [Candidatus Paceibacterota bacterium]